MEDFYTFIELANWVWLKLFLLHLHTDLIFVQLY